MSQYDIESTLKHCVQFKFTVKNNNNNKMKMWKNAIPQPTQRGEHSFTEHHSWCLSYLKLKKQNSLSEMLWINMIPNVPQKILTQKIHSGLNYWQLIGIMD